MSKQVEPRKASKPKTEKKVTKKNKVNDIIQKIVDVHATADQALAEMAYDCKEKCEGK
jgi:hypothetical protein